MGPPPGLRKSKVRMIRSTPAVATMLERYLFQSCVKASDFSKAGRLVMREDISWIGIERIRWLDAEAGVRRSKTRRVESEETDEMIDGECGEKAVL
jgi:hypothetical protein